MSDQRRADLDARQPQEARDSSFPDEAPQRGAGDSNGHEAPHVGYNVKLGSGHDPQRALLITDCFDLLNRSESGFISMAEMRALADFMGFAGTAVEWRAEWFDMCAYLGCSPQHGMDSLAFALLVNDRSDHGCFCCNGDFRDFREELPFMRPPKN